MPVHFGFSSPKTPYFLTPKCGNINKINQNEKSRRLLLKVRERSNQQRELSEQLLN